MNRISTPRFNSWTIVNIHEIPVSQSTDTFVKIIIIISTGELCDL
jgi:hypothetical protein